MSLKGLKQILEQIISTDKELFRWLNLHVHSNFFDPIMVFLTTISNLAIIWLLIALWLCIKRKQIGSILPGFTLILSIGIAFVVDAILNAMVNRPRPPLAQE